jgi:hypothetical protein
MTCVARVSGTPMRADADSQFDIPAIGNRNRASMEEHNSFALYFYTEEPLAHETTPSQ